MPLFPSNQNARYPGIYCWFCGHELAPDAAAPFEPRRCTECARMNTDGLEHQRPFRSTREIPTAEQTLSEWMTAGIVAMALHAAVVIVLALANGRPWSVNTAVLVSLAAGALAGVFRAGVVASHIAPMGERTRTVAAMWLHYPLPWALAAAALPLLLFVAFWMYP